MAVTQGHGNPHWTRDEVILALSLYFDCEGSIPGPSDARVKALSALLRAFPHHSASARKVSFRNPDGVAFKLQNLRQVATGKGLGNVSQMDREVWHELGGDRPRTKQLADLIRTGIAIVEHVRDDNNVDEVFAEGRVVTETHLRRERDARVRDRLLDQRRKAGGLSCDICDYNGARHPTEVRDAVFEAHHILPLSAGRERRTHVKDLALLCANCHRMTHRAIAQSKRWLSVNEAAEVILQKVQSDRRLE